MKLQHLKTLRTIVKLRKMKENIKSTELSAINSKIVANDTKQQRIYSLFNQSSALGPTDSGSIVTAINYYQKQSKELHKSKEHSKLLASEAKELLTEFQTLYVERKVAENILEDGIDSQKKSVSRKAVSLYDELGLMARR